MMANLSIISLAVFVGIAGLKILKTFQKSFHVSVYLLESAEFGSNFSIFILIELNKVVESTRLNFNPLMQTLHLKNGHIHFKILMAVAERFLKCV